MESLSNYQMEIPRTESEYLNRTNLQILLNQNDIVPILQKINKQSKLIGRQITLSEMISDPKVRIIIQKYNKKKFR